MCGIAGIIGFKDKEKSGAAVARMTDCLRHRGPDAAGFFVDENAALGHRRLSIIDLSETANQPLFDSNERYAIIFNGEIYNFQEVKNLLPDYPFQTDSDTEVLLAAYAKFGAECLDLLNGMFAFVIWDKQRRELFAARDRLGVKPFYYALTADGKFVFASEIRAILSSDLIEKRLSEQGLYDYIMYQSVYAPRTIVKDIFQLGAGEYGIFADGRFEKKSYWRLADKHAAEIFDDEETIKKTVRNLLRESVERRMIADVPLGAFLSGGIDSSAIVALMAEVSAAPVNTFSVNFGEQEYDESVYSNLIAAKYNTRHNSVFLTADDFLAELPNALAAIDAPSGDGINTYVVSKATRRAGITVALSGLGGDELFAGYNYFTQWLKMRNGFLPKIPNVFRKPAAFAFAQSANSKHQRMADILAADEISLANVYPRFRQVLSEKIVNDLRGKQGEISIRNILTAKADDIAEFPPLSQVSIAELLGYTQNVLLKDTDQFSMASALEVREPFFDYKLVEYVLQIPDRFKFPKYPKSLLVESLAPLLPGEIVHRKKMGFVLPWQKWMRGELKEFCQRRLENLAARGIIDAPQLLRKWNDFQRGANGVIWSQLWHLVVLEEWLEKNKF